MTEFKIISKKEFLKNNEKPEQKEIWNGISESWKEYRQAKIPAVVEFLKGKKGKVIDLGCGSGRNMIKNKNIEYYGVDFSKEQLENAEARALKDKIKAKFFLQNADNLKIFNNEFFDYGLFIATLHCLEDENKRKNALREFYRVLKKGGEGLISVWNSEDKRFDNFRDNKEIYMSWKDKGILNMRYYYLYSKEELIGLLKEVGFNNIFIYKIEKHNDRFSKKNWIVKVRK